MESMPGVLKVQKFGLCFTYFALVRTKPLSVSDQCFSANLSSYSHYVFSAMDLQETGVITFEVKGRQFGASTWFVGAAT
jgi:hypothetical protein